MRTCAFLERTSWVPRVPRFANDPVLRRCAFNRCSILDTDARREQDNRRRKRPKQPPAGGHREGADKEGTLAAMKALWRELADPKSRNIAATS